MRDCHPGEFPWPRPGKDPEFGRSFLPGRFNESAGGAHRAAAAISSALGT
jgi:hypothetical protein